MPCHYFLIYSFDNDDMKSSKRHVTLLTLIFLLKLLLSLKNNGYLQFSIWIPMALAKFSFKLGKNNYPFIRKHHP